MLIAIDVDGVVCDLHTPWLGQYNEDYNDILTPANITDWAMDKFVKPECGKRIYDYLQTNLYANAPIVPGARDAIAALRSAKHKLVFATSCVGGGMLEWKREWLHTHGFLSRMPRNFPEYIAVSDKGWLRADLLIDDGAHNIEDFVGAGGPQAMLFDQPWNGTAAVKTWVDDLRVRDWNHVVEELL